MNRLTVLSRGFDTLRSILRRHQLLALTLLVFFVVSVSSRVMLRGSILGGTNLGGTFGVNQVEDVRSCSSVGSLFEQANSLAEARHIFSSRMSAVVAEREKILSTPSEWKCSASPGGDEPNISELKSLANDLPGWHYQYYTQMPPSIPITIQKPVTFDAFGAIVSELMRSYECRLTEFEDQTLAAVVANYDAIDEAQYCCGNFGCRKSSEQIACTGPTSADPQCNQQCPILTVVNDLVTRPDVYHAEQRTEKQRARVAVERTLRTLHSFEMNYVIAKQLFCYQRASLDLKNELGLLADVTSCLPKIWDAVTSIHDPKQ